MPKALPYLALLLLSIAPASAQSGGTGIGPVDDTYAYVEYTLNNTLNPGNGTTPPGNGTTGNGTSPPGNGTNPPGNTTNPPGNSTNPPGNGTNPPGNSTTPPGNGTGNTTAPPSSGNETGNQTTDETAGNETSEGGNQTSSQNETAGGVQAGGNATLGAEWSGGTDPDDGCASCLEETVEVKVTAQDVGGEGLDEDGAASSCLGAACQRSRAISTPPSVTPGFPWLPLLVTLTLAPLAGLLVARYAIRRWQIGKPTKKPHAHVNVGIKGPPDAHDPMRKFLMDVKEWRATPVPGVEPMPVASSASVVATSTK